MVREGSSPPPERTGLPHSLCGRLPDRGGPRRRRPADHGSLAQADEQVRFDGPPGEDALGPVPSGRRGRLRSQGSELDRSADIRFPGFHPLLGPKLKGRMGGQAQDGKEPTEASVSIALGLVPAEPASTDRGSTPDAQAEVARPFCVLWDHRQLPQSPGVPGGSQEDLATLAIPAPPRWRNHLVRISPSGEALRFTKGTRVHSRLSSAAKSSDEEPGAFDVHARICGGPGWETTQVYPAQAFFTTGHVAKTENRP